MDLGIPRHHGDRRHSGGLVSFDMHPMKGRMTTQTMRGLAE